MIKMLLVVGSVIVPVGMVVFQRWFHKCRLLFNVIAVVATLTLGNISAIAIYNIIRDNTVFMTNIHALFLNPFFLIAGAYLLVNLVYILLLTCLKEIKGN